MTRPRGVRSTAVVIVLLMAFCILDVVQAADYQRIGGAGTSGQWEVSYANLEPDYFLETQPDGLGSKVSISIGGYIRIVVVNRGPEEDR